MEKNAILYQFLYGNLFPKCFSRTNDYGVKAKTLFNTYYQNFNIQKNIINWQNNNLQIKEEEDNNESTPINMTTLNDENDEIVTKNIEIKNENENENENDGKKKKKIYKRKNSDTETKERKRQLKKQRLLKQLNENTEKLQKLKKKKTNKINKM